VAVLRLGCRLISLLAVSSVLLSACALQQDIAAAPPSGKTGFAAPAVSGQTLDGQALAVSFRAHRTVLVFWASWCGPCRHEQPYITQMAKDLAFQGVRFIGVDFLDRDHAAATAFVQEFRVPYPSIYDPDGKIAAAYQVDSPPAKVLVDGRGIVVARIDGETTTDKLERLIQAKLLSG